jgi:DNA invertase Pin-like site-specific DNA recombinase
MASYSYIGMSSADQNLQFNAVVSMTEKSMGKIELIIEETPARRRLAEMVERLLDGDLVLIFDFAQLANTWIGVVEMLSTLANMGVTVRSVQEGEANPNIALFLQSLLAEIQRDINQPDETLTEQRVRRRGRPTGSRLDLHKKTIQQLLNDGASHSAIAGQFEISRQSFKDFVVSRGLLR